MLFNFEGIRVIFKLHIQKMKRFLLFALSQFADGAKISCPVLTCVDQDPTLPVQKQDLCYIADGE